MPRSWSRFNVVALLVIAVACSAPVRASQPDAVRLTGCFRRIYGDGPPGSGVGGVWYTLTTDAGATRVLELSPALLASAGGPSLLDGARVSVIVDPARDSSDSGATTARVREIRRDSSSAAPC
jgi:hypothetical protein